jgi:hypothetical protein
VNNSNAVAAAAKASLSELVRLEDNHTAPALLTFTAASALLFCNKIYPDASDKLITPETPRRALAPTSRHFGDLVRTKLKFYMNTASTATAHLQRCFEDVG